MSNSPASDAPVNEMILSDPVSDGVPPLARPAVDVLRAVRTEGPAGGGTSLSVCRGSGARARLASRAQLWTGRIARPTGEWGRSPVFAQHLGVGRRTDSLLLAVTALGGSHSQRPVVFGVRVSALGVRVSSTKDRLSLPIPPIQGVDANNVDCRRM